jgi:hypothetical protein
VQRLISSCQLKFQAHLTYCPAKFANCHVPDIRHSFCATAVFVAVLTLCCVACGITCKNAVTRSTSCAAPGFTVLHHAGLGLWLQSHASVFYVEGCGCRYVLTCLRVVVVDTCLPA